MNAFAIGRGRHDSWLVISQSLLDALTLDELSAVIGHEITHITNGDMLILVLMQDVVNVSVYYPARLPGGGVDRLFFQDSPIGPTYKVISLFLQLVLGAVLAGYPEMMAALRRLRAGGRAEVKFVLCSRSWV